jgi:heme oxygenase (biliverdin-IX-beta and delta-forming)
VTLLDRLKAETRQAHDHMERVVDIEARVSSITAYRQLLARFYGLHAVWEAEAKAIIADPWLLTGRTRTPLLMRDLAALGAGPDEIRDLPLCPPLLRTPVLAEALGALYVVEGSTLGGAVVAKHVERTLGLGAANGCAYFRSHGAAVGAMWRDFKARLLAFSSPEIDDDVVAAANRTFAHLSAWFAQEAAR